MDTPRDSQGFWARVRRGQVLVALAMTLAGCGSTVVSRSDTPAPDGGATLDGGADTPAPATCSCPAGRCAVGTRWRAPDGCNDCSCEQGGVPVCTDRACGDAGPAPDAREDAGARRCRTTSDCRAGEVCAWERGCERTAGSCVDAGCQTLPVAPQYCACDGTTLQQRSACLPEQAWAREGACAARDAGARRRHPDAVMAWQSPGGFAGWGPAVRVRGETIEYWSMRTGFDLDAPAPAPERVVPVSPDDADALFDLWRAVPLASLPHPGRPQECSPRVDVRLCATCPTQTLRYQHPRDLLPEMDAVWTWFDRRLPGASPRRYCDAS